MRFDKATRIKPGAFASAGLLSIGGALASRAGPSWSTPIDTELRGHPGLDPESPPERPIKVQAWIPALRFAPAGMIRISMKRSRR
jgi:hypothetical protein